MDRKDSVSTPLVGVSLQQLKLAVFAKQTKKTFIVKRFSDRDQCPKIPLVRQIEYGGYWYETLAIDAIYRLT